MIDKETGKIIYVSIRKASAAMSLEEKLKHDLPRSIKPKALYEMVINQGKAGYHISSDLKRGTVTRLRRYRTKTTDIIHAPSKRQRIFKKVVKALETQGEQFCLSEHYPFDIYFPDDSYIVITPDASINSSGGLATKAKFKYVLWKLEEKRK